MTEGNQRNLPILKTGDQEQTTVGNYFVANYPPFSFWSRDAVDTAHQRLQTAPDAAAQNQSYYPHKYPFSLTCSHVCKS